MQPLQVQTNIHELERLYRGSSQIIAARSENELVQAVDRILQDLPYAAAMLLWHSQKLEIAALNNLEVKASLQDAVDNLGSNLSGQLELFTHSKNFKDLAKLESPLPLDEVQKFLSGNPVIIDKNSTALPSSLKRFANQLNHQSTAVLPIKQGNKLKGLIILGANSQSLTSAIVQPYVDMTDLISAALEKMADMEAKEERLRELESITSLGQVVSKTSDLNSFYAALHTQVRNVIGDFPFVVALYQKETASILIPYMYEAGKVDSVEAFPLGEGLTSVLIQTQQPLILVEDTEKQAGKLGAKIQGTLARSWMGAPMVVQGESLER